MTNKDLLMVMHDYHPAFYKLAIKGMCVKDFTLEPRVKCIGCTCELCWEKTMAWLNAETHDE